MALSSRMPRSLTAALAMLCLLTLTGCVEKAVAEGVTTLTNASWVYGLIGLAGVALAIIGGVAIKEAWWQGGLTLLVGLGILIVGVPTYLLEKTTVREDGFRVQTGFFGGTVHDVKYDDIANIELTSEEVRTRRGGRRTKYYILLHMKSGGDIKLDASDGVAEEAAPLILAGAKAHGVKGLEEVEEEPVEPVE